MKNWETASSKPPFEGMFSGVSLLHPCVLSWDIIGRGNFAKPGLGFVIMCNEPFAEGNSIFHRMDPRAKLVLAVAFSVLVAVMSGFAALYAAFFLAVCMAGAARLNPGALFSRLALVNGFVLMLWVILPLTFPGGPRVHLGPVPISTDGLLAASGITLRSNAILLAFIALVSTSPTATVATALGRMGMPSKAVFLLMFTYRYLWVMEEEYLRLKRAAELRGFVLKTDLHTYKTVANLFAMVLVRAGLKGKRVHQAMKLRGFTGRFYPVKELRFTAGDAGAFAVLLALFGSVGVVEWMI